MQGYYPRPERLLPSLTLKTFCKTCSIRRFYSLRLKISDKFTTIQNIISCLEFRGGCVQNLFNNAMQESLIRAQTMLGSKWDIAEKGLNGSRKVGLHLINTPQLLHRVKKIQYSCSSVFIFFATVFPCTVSPGFRQLLQELIIWAVKFVICWNGIYMTFAVWNNVKVQVQLLCRHLSFSVISSSQYKTSWVCLEINQTVIRENFLNSWKEEENPTSFRCSSSGRIYS